MELKGNRYSIEHKGMITILKSYNRLAIVTTPTNTFINRDIINYSATTNNHFKHYLKLEGKDWKDFKDMENENFIYLREREMEGEIN